MGSQMQMRPLHTGYIGNVPRLRPRPGLLFRTIPLPSSRPWWRKRPPTQPLRRWRNADRPTHPREGQRLEIPASSSRSKTLPIWPSSSGHRSRPFGLSAVSIRPLRRAERRPHARSGDVFRVSRRGSLTLGTTENDYVGVEQWSRNIVRGHYLQLANLHAQHQRFARTATATDNGCISP